ncbi:MAG: hypothetical protein JNL98_43010, partial [Bryobacterales bacterium]|nr:hypothetical protein [Bryobacterales bacterium]
STDFTSGADTATPAPIATDAPAAASTDAPDWETLRPPRSRFWHFAPGLWLRGGNRIEAPAWMRARLRFATLFHYNARNNVVSVGKGFSSRGLTIRFTGSGNRVEIADNVDFSGEIAIVGKGLCVSIGARSHLRDAKIGVRGAGVRVGQGVVQRWSLRHVGCVPLSSSVPLVRASLCPAPGAQPYPGGLCWRLAGRGAAGQSVGAGARPQNTTRSVFATASSTAS